MSAATRLPSDAFVFFGASGDLAYKQIFPALQALTRKGCLDMPVIGVASSRWTVDRLRRGRLARSGTTADVAVMRPHHAKESQT